MELFDEPFEMRQWQDGEGPEEAVPITEEDKDLIVEHINELFGLGREAHPMLPGGEDPITEDDKRLMIWHIDELFLL